MLILPAKTPKRLAIFLANSKKRCWFLLLFDYKTETFLPSTVHTYTKLIKRHQDLSNRFFNIANLQTLFRQKLDKYEPNTLHLELSALTSYAKFQKIKIEWEEVTKILPHRVKKFFTTINLD